MPEGNVEREEGACKQHEPVGWARRAPLDQEDEAQQNRRGEDIAPEGYALRPQLAETQPQADGRKANADAAGQDHERSDPVTGDQGCLGVKGGHAALVMARISSGVIPSSR